MAIRNVNIIGCDTAVDIPQLMQSWNCQIHHWLKYYVMLRWIDRTRDRHIVQAFPIAMSFFMSLVWHGFWSGYFIIFMGAAACDIIYKNLRRAALVQSLKAVIPRPIYIALWFPINRFIFSFVTFSFHF